MRNASMLATIKLESGCVDCGYNDNPVALDFDHVNGDKVFSLSQKKGASIETLLNEAEKCVVRCANCHRIKTFEERERMYGTEGSA